MIKFYKYDPVHDLAKYVDSYFIITTGKYSSLEENQHNLDKALRNHPQGTFDLMFVLRGPGIRLSTLDEQQLSLSKIFVMAQQEGMFEISFLPDNFIFGVVFHGESFNKFFNLPLAELANSGAAVMDELDNGYLELFDALIEKTPNHGQIIALANQYLHRQLESINHEFSKFDKLVEHMRLTNGSHSIDELSNMANMSKRSLQRSMKNKLGISPKSYSNTMRFRRAMKLIVNQPNFDWQDIMFECDYFDQSHFIKDFKKFTGYTPTEFLKQQLTLSEFFESN